MKTKNTFIVVLILFSRTLLAQDHSESKYAIQFDYGRARTLHHQPPVNFRMCFEGCYAEEQLARTAPHFDVSLYRKLDNRNGIKVGFGFSSYQFLEKGLISPGSGGMTPYETNQDLRYFDIVTGYRRIFGTNKIICPFFEAELLFEFYRAESDYLKKCGVAIKPQLGVVLNISDKLSVVVDGFYKTGIVKYNAVTYDKAYIPFGYGIEAGLNIKL